MLHTPPLDMQEGRMCTAHCGCMWLDMVKMNRSLNLHLAPPSLHLKLRPHDLCFLALTPPPTPDIWPAPAKTNTSRPKRPPLTEAPETQRGGRAHHSEGPVRLAACPAIGCVGQREQSRRQTPDPQESRVRRKAAEHRRWEFAQESPLCRVTEAQMEQGEKERVREREDAILLTHTCRKKGREFYRKTERKLHITRDSCSETRFSQRPPTQLTNTRKWMSQTAMWFTESEHRATMPHIRCATTPTSLHWTGISELLRQK